MVFSDMFTQPLRHAASFRAALVLVASLTGVLGVVAAPANVRIGIGVEPQADATVRFAARELQRYLYLAGGEFLPIAEVSSADAATRHLLSRQSSASGELGAESYEIRYEASAPGGPRVTILGGDSIGVLYGVYRFAEKLGVRFYLHGEVVPDRPGALPRESFEERGRPLFDVRGLQPFHDFAEGPDWWNADDYRAHLGQMAKMRMNFLGLHTYPESQVGPEPTVWIGLEDQMDERGRVTAAYPASYHTTGRSGRTWWAYAPVRTSEFSGGAADLFERDEFGPDVMNGHSFAEQTVTTAAEVFNRTGDLLAEAFAEARRLNILTCIGTETPLTIPEAVRAELVRRGQNPDDPATARALYRAMFERIRRAYPVDYYWLWTPETWTWEGNQPEHFAKTADDIQAALDALNDLGNPFTLATCGWVLGPQHDRAALDKLLPLSSPMSAINSSVGHVAIERQFTNLSRRPRWVIPWLENDGNLTSPQLWVGRMRYDAADALRLGATGLIGIHWRTRVLAPQIAALAGAAWEQEWTPASFDRAPIPPLTASGATGGRSVVAQSTDAARSPAKSNRVGMHAYDMLVPSGDYTLRLGFSELENTAPGARVFSVKLNGQTYIEHLDIAAAGGAVVREFKNFNIPEARLLIEFVAERGEPSIAFIELQATTSVGNASFSRRINCGGPAFDDFEADQLPGQPRPPLDRAMPVEDFYHDFAAVHFGSEAANDIAAIFSRIDGLPLPMPTGWIDGPGDITRNREPWSKVSANYAFVAELEALRPRVRGAANLDRFDYWLNQFRALRLIAQIGCTAGALDVVMEKLSAAEASARQQIALTEALPLRVELAQLWTTLLRTEIAAASNPGELGTLANLEQRSRVHQRVLDRHDVALVQALGCDLPLSAYPENTYDGPTRFIVPTVRTAAAPGEAIKLRVIVASPDAPADAVLAWRPIGDTEYRRVPLNHVARRVYDVALPALTEQQPAIEYHLEATVGTEQIRWPVSDHGRDQTVILADQR